MPADVAALRQEYRRHSLDESEVAPVPTTQFRIWFEEAIAAEVPEPNAMTLATADAEGRPAARIVLLKGFAEDGFTFFTNYESRKGRELAENPHAALVFWWGVLERQVRIEGTVERVPDNESDAYFQTRPRASRLGAWASPQSDVIASRMVLEKKLAEVTEAYEGQEVSRPPHWGGYLLRPATVEFWQGRPGRLHDRLRYLRTDEGWTIERLAP